MRFKGIFDVSMDSGSAGVQSLVGDYSVATDGETLLCSGTLTVTLAPASNGYSTTVVNVGTGTVTVAVSGTDTIEGAGRVLMPDQYGAETFHGDRVSTHYRG